MSTPHADADAACSDHPPFPPFPCREDGIFWEGGPRKGRYPGLKPAMFAHNLTAAAWEPFVHLMTQVCTARAQRFPPPPPARLPRDTRATPAAPPAPSARAR